MSTLETMLELRDMLSVVIRFARGAKDRQDILCDLYIHEFHDGSIEERLSYTMLHTT